MVYPDVAYPTYAGRGAAWPVAARRLRRPGRARRRRPALVWINSPANPTGQILSAGDARRPGRTGPGSGARSWPPTSATASSAGTPSRSRCCIPSVSGGDHDGLLAVHSLSKRSNLAGYRAGFVAGDDRLVTELLGVRKHAGMIVPGPVQEAMIALLADQDHVERAAAVATWRRRAILRPALEAAGFRIEHSEGSLYLWATRDEDSRASVDFLAGLGSWSHRATSTARPPPARPGRPDRNRRADRRRGVTTRRLRLISQRRVISTCRSAERRVPLVQRAG